MVDWNSKNESYDQNATEPQILNCRHYLSKLTLLNKYAKYLNTLPSFVQDVIIPKFWGNEAYANSILHRVYITPEMTINYFDKILCQLFIWWRSVVLSVL